jgi:hypothetical protein
MLEHTHGWSGVLIEANPDMFHTLDINRPGQMVVHAAVCDAPKQIHWRKSSSVGTRGIMEFIPALQDKAKFKSDWDGSVQMVCMPLTDILNEVGWSSIDTKTEKMHVDFWSLDVEGAEMMVLQGVDFDHFSFGVLAVETEMTGPVGRLQHFRAQVRAKLESHGYISHSNDVSNDWFVHPEGVGTGAEWKT